MGASRLLVSFLPPIFFLCVPVYLCTYVSLTSDLSLLLDGSMGPTAGLYSSYLSSSHHMRAEFLTGSIEEVSVTTGLGQAFLGMIVLPIAGNACEHMTAVIVAVKDKMDLSMGKH